MSQQEKNIHHYSVEDFERYHSGKMPEQEMHALEKAALEDPFLSDALDGYVNTKTAMADINELKIKLQDNGNKKIVWYKRKNLSSLLKIAAVLILITGFGLLLYKNNAPVKTETASAREDNNKTQLEKIVANEATDSMTTMLKAEAPVASRSETEKMVQQAAPVLKNKKETFLNAKPITINSGSAAATTEQYTVTLKDSALASTSYSYTPAENNNIDRALAGKVSGIQVTPSQTIKGRVTDSKGSPVAYATVVDKKNNQAVSADNEGTFALTTSDSAAQVNVNAVGFATVSKELSNDSRQNNVVLQPAGNQLNEVVVTSAFGTERKQRDNSSPDYFYKNAGKDKNIQRITITNAIPVKGWQDFNNYVSDSLKTLEQLGPNSVTAEVVVTFSVNDRGEPVDIHVQHSLCIPCDAEVIRIIKNGPQWKLNNKRKKANAVVRF